MADPNYENPASFSDRIGLERLAEIAWDFPDHDIRTYRKASQRYEESHRNREDAESDEGQQSDHQLSAARRALLEKAEAIVDGVVVYGLPGEIAMLVEFIRIVNKNSTYEELLEAAKPVRIAAGAIHAHAKSALRRQKGEATGNAEERGKQVGTQTDEIPSLSERKYLILRTLLVMKATSADHRKTTERIVLRADGKAADPVHFKKDISTLKKTGFIITKKGRGGGCWLTTKGCELANLLARLKGATNDRTE